MLILRTSVVEDGVTDINKDVLHELNMVSIWCKVEPKSTNVFNEQLSTDTSVNTIGDRLVVVVINVASTESE